MVKNYKLRKDEIIKLYEDHSVEDVVKIMERRGFSASRRWYLSKFSDWGCQKTSNRKRIAKRHSREAPVVVSEDENFGFAEPQNSENKNICGKLQVARASSTPLKHTNATHFLLECPHSSKCPEAPFLTVEDYDDHKEMHHTRTLDAFRWESSQTATGAMLEKYLIELIEDGWNDDLINCSLFSDRLRPQNQRQHLYDPLDIMDCAEVLLHLGLNENISICSFKAIAAREATFWDALSALRYLQLAAVKILGSEPSHYPQIIDWIFDLVMACGSGSGSEDDALNWDSVRAHLCRIQEHASLPSCLKEYVGTFILQECLDNFSIWLQKGPYLDLVLEVCTAFSIPLDVEWILPLRTLDPVGAQQPPAPLLERQPLVASLQRAYHERTSSPQN